MGAVLQDRYAGDVGDFAKFALLRSLGDGKKLGVAWYLYPDEAHNSDGRHTQYLRDPEKWRHLDSEAFDALSATAHDATLGRTVEGIERAGFLQGTFFNERLLTASLPHGQRSEWRKNWFERLQIKLADSDLVFADPDNGLIDDTAKRRSQKTFGKQMPLLEAKALAVNRTAVLYHHNTRRAGGHSAEVQHWIEQLGEGTVAVRANAYSCRTFFIVNADGDMKEKARAFCQRWSKHAVKFQE